MRGRIRINLKAHRDAEKITKELMRGDRDQADRFRQDLIDTLDHILQYPGGFQIRFRNYRYAPLSVFKYQVIYSRQGDHCASDPAYAATAAAAVLRQ